MLLLLLNMGVLDAMQAQAHLEQKRRLRAPNVWKEKLRGKLAKKGSTKELRAKIRVELHHIAGSLKEGRALLARGQALETEVSRMETLLAAGDALLKDQNAPPDTLQRFLMVAEKASEARAKPVSAIPAVAPTLYGRAGAQERARKRAMMARAWEARMSR